MSKRVDHVVSENGGGTATCLNCGGKYTMNLPCLVSVWASAMKAFVKAHSQCKPKRAGI